VNRRFAVFKPACPASEGHFHSGIPPFAETRCLRLCRHPFHEGTLCTLRVRDRPAPSVTPHPPIHVLARDLLTLSCHDRSGKAHRGLTRRCSGLATLAAELHFVRRHFVQRAEEASLFQRSSSVGRRQPQPCREACLLPCYRLLEQPLSLATDRQDFFAAAATTSVNSPTPAPLSYRSTVRGRLGVALVILPIALILFVDAGTFALSPGDPAHGRPKGCYTILDRFFGTRPSELRGLELILSLGFGVGAFIWLFRPTRSKDAAVPL